MKYHKFIVGEEDCLSDRLDVFISDKLDISRSKVTNLIKNGDLVLNNDVFKRASYKVRLNDELKVGVPEKEAKFKAQETELNIVFEDDDILVINKAHGVVVHPGTGNKEDTLSNYVYGYLGSFPFLVHRLDKDTSGLIVFAKQWRNRKVGKHYITLVVGTLDSEKGVIDSPIERNKLKRKEMTISNSSTARISKTSFTVLGKYDESTLVDVQIHTGRTHQIRVHFKAIGHPVLGDKLYGNSKANREFYNKYSLKRQFLHASKLSFVHPSSGKNLSFEAELPEDLQKVLDGLIINSNN